MSGTLSLPAGGEDQPRRRSRVRLRRPLLGLIAPALAVLMLAAAAAPAGAQAATTGTIDGSFTVPASAHSPKDVTVQLVTTDGSAAANHETVTDTSATTASYALDDVAPGQYYLYFSDDTAGDNVAPDYYGDGGADNITKAAVVTVAATGGTQTLAATTLATGASITGTVTDANAAAETSAHVYAELVSAGAEQDPLLGAVAATVSNGSYTITGLPAGSYTLRYGASGGSLRLSEIYADGSGVSYDYGSATRYAVTGGTSTTASFTVPVVGGISGTVTNATGTPLDGVGVVVYDAAGTEIPPAATTGADGTYTVAGVLPGSYEVEFEGLALSNLATTFYGGATLATAAKVTVAGGLTTPNVNGALSAAASVSGMVTAAQGGAAVGGLAVELLDAQGNVVSATFTNPDGSYTLSGVPAGTWYLEFVGGRAYNGQYYATEYYLGKGTLGGATALKLTPGENLTGINEALLPESTTLPGLPKVSGGALSGLSSDKVALKFKLSAGSGPAGYLKSFSIKLPKNVSWNKSALKADIVIARDTFTYAIKSGRLVITFATGKKTVSFQIKAGGITVSKAIQAQAKKRTIKSEAIAVAVTDTTGKASSLSFTVKKPH